MQPQSIPQNPQNMQAFAQMLAAQGFGPPNLTSAPQGMPQGAPSPQSISPVPQQPGMPPQGMPPQGQPQPQGLPPGPQPPQGGMQNPSQRRFTEQELSALGRMGDTTIAHMTPGEITVPQQVQTPKVLATLKKEYHKKGVDPSQFTVGSPQSSVNPSTGLHEYNFWSSFLPMALGAAGGIFGGPLGAAAGTTLGGMAGGQKFGNAAMSGALAGLGDWGLGSLVGGTGSLSSMFGNADADAAAGAAGNSTSGAGAMAGGVPSSAPSGGPLGDILNQGLSNSPSGYIAAAPQAQVAADVAAAGNGMGGAPSNLGNLYGMLPKGTNIGNVAGAGIGASLGNSMFGQQSSTTNGLPSNFNKPYTPASQLPSAQNQLGYNTYNGPTANFTGYNPATNNPMAYNFFGQ